MTNSNDNLVLTGIYFDVEGNLVDEEGAILVDENDLVEVEFDETYGQTIEPDQELVYNLLGPGHRYL